MTDTASPSLDDTLHALDGGPTGVTPSAALALVDHWVAACAAHGLPGIVDDLSELRRHLRGRLDGAAIGRTLTSLADGTETAAASAGDAGPGLLRLAATLRRFARVIG